MANQIIILDVIPTSTGDQLVRFLFWFYPPVANQVPQPGAVSLWRGATPTDNANLNSGSVIEELSSVVFLQGMSVAEIKNYLQTRWTKRQNQLTTGPNPNAFYGANWDGTTWIGV